MKPRRSRAREVALQVLYQEEVNPSQQAEYIQGFVRRRLRNRELEEFSMSLIIGVKQNLAELDETLTKTALNWSLKRMSGTDRNVLRIGVFEILHTETPDRVAINEAIDLAKRYGGAHSAAFVNGILDKLLAEHIPG